MKKEYFAYGSVLEALSFGLYPDKRHVIREFIQNAFDALSAWRELSGEKLFNPIQIKVQKPSIFIADRGIGMDKNEAQKFRYFGYSEKDREKTVGFRGIGKDSGLAIAEKIIVTTSPHNYPKRYTIIVDAQKMLEEIASGKNPPLEELLEKYSVIKEKQEDRSLHYTFVELHNIRKDAQIIYDIETLKDYISHNCPVPFDPDFDWADEITERLKSNVSSFSQVEIILNGEKLYKKFPANYTRPEYEPVFKGDEDGSPLIAHCWYCGHKEKGQFSDRENSGLIYRIKNFAIGDRHLTRKTLWRTTPERAFYFFGEIHILDENVIPSSDRTDFEDNKTRDLLYERCRKIAQILNHRAGSESAQRRFGKVITSVDEMIARRKSSFEKTEIPIQFKSEVEYEIRKAIEDIENRLRRTVTKRKKSGRDKELIKEGEKVIKKTRELLKIVKSEEVFIDVGDKVELNEQARQVYQIIIDCLKEELSSDWKQLERIIHKINETLVKFLKKVPICH